MPIFKTALLSFSLFFSLPLLCLAEEIPMPDPVDAIIIKSTESSTGAALKANAKLIKEIESYFSSSVSKKENSDRIASLKEKLDEVKTWDKVHFDNIKTDDTSKYPVIIRGLFEQHTKAILDIQRKNNITIASNIEQWLKTGEAKKEPDTVLDAVKAKVIELKRWNDKTFTDSDLLGEKQKKAAEDKIASAKFLKYLEGEWELIPGTGKGGFAIWKGKPVFNTKAMTVSLYWGVSKIIVNGTSVSLDVGPAEGKGCSIDGDGILHCSWWNANQAQYRKKSDK